MKKTQILQSDIKRYDVDPLIGLSNEQVNERINDNLVNKVKNKYSKSVLSIFCSNIFTFFNLLGIIVAIALIVIQAPLSRFFFCLIYIANILIGIIQELRAKSCIDKLTLVAQKNSKVIRNGETIEIPSSSIVLDDVILLSLGNQIPTDSIVLEGFVEVNESLLTGESVPIKKNVGDKLLAGSFITTGNCKAKAEKVGKDNYIETLSEKAKQYKKPYSELMSSLNKIIKFISIIIIPIATAFLIKSIVFNDATLPDAISSASTVIIGMIPSGMFLLTSTALAIGVIKLARHNTLVQDLYSLEMLARVDTVCFDKTGTITSGEMSVKEVVSLTKSKINEKEIVSSMLYALKDNNQTALALSKYFGEEEVFKAKHSLPFNSARKLSAVTFEKKGTFAFGAPEYILSKEEFSTLEEKINNYAKFGLRVLLLAKSTKSITDDTIPNDFKPLSLIILQDNIREEAIETIKWFKENDVQIKVISGDNPLTVSEVSKQVGIENADKYISLEGLSDEEVYKIANEYTVFGRVSPEQKAILIKSLKDNGHTTAMTGDGVNDILALKQADCAITVATGSDAARNVSNIVLMDNNFNSLPKVVYEGRRVVNNVQRSSSLFLMKTLFTMILSVIMLCLPYMDRYPFDLEHMIMLEVFVIGIPSFFLSIQPNAERIKGKFIKTVLKNSVPSAVLMILSVMAIEILKLTIGKGVSEDVYISMQVVALTFAGTFSLLKICLPLNVYRTFVFALNTLFIVALTTISLTQGLTAVSIIPLTSYTRELIILGVILALQYPMLMLLNFICKKIKILENN